MKHLIISSISMFMLALLFVSCNSKSDKSNINDDRNSNSNVNENIELSKENRQKMNVEYNEFMRKANEDIKRNEEKIDQEIANIQRANKTINDTRGKHIMILKKRNTELNNRLNRYDMNSGDWERFKKDFNNDMARIGDSFKDLFSED